MKKYAELHRNVQRYRIKSRYDNKLGLRSALDSIESTRTALKTATEMASISFKPIDMTEAFEGVGAMKDFMKHGG